MEKNKVSVITICFNSANFIEATIKSVFAQTYKNVEYIIIDGGSTDGTCEIIENYRLKLSYYSSEKDGGIYDAMNKGVRHALGEWVIFMNSGDCFSSNDVLENVMKYHFSNETGVIYGDVISVYSDTERFEKACEVKKLSYKMPFCHQSCLIRTSLQKDFPYDTNYQIAADYKFFNTIYYKFGEKVFTYIPITIAKIDCTDSLTQKKKYLCWTEFIDVRSHHKDARWYYDVIKKYIKQILGYGKL